VITAIGILRLKDEMDKVIYVRIHILGVMDIASILALIGLNQPLLAGIYFILAPFVAHAMANAYYHGEDECKYESIDSDYDNLNGGTGEDKV
jgi:energy-converting hydrogenase B subunit C